ncbi:hypothetical protein [Kitasatospora sp. NPDC017646]|uniref:hypothetical protein n=1 Tax=Kitasatospora sp. NPDC017646 TaxID=3364024 RepID=UPI003791168A
MSEHRSPDLPGEELDRVPPALARSLLRGMLADPRHLPELLAAFAVRNMGPRAATAVARLRAQRPDLDREQQRILLTSRGIRITTTEGAFVGGPSMLLIPVAFCAALLVQAQLVLELAVLAGLDPTEPERGAELLVLQTAYADTGAAREAMNALPAVADDRARHGPAAVWAVCRRMAHLLGLVSPLQEGERRPSRLERAGRWALLGAVLCVGMAAPLVWLPYLGASYRSSTIRIARRAGRRYLDSAEPSGIEPARTDPGVVAALLRALLSVLFTLGLLLLVPLVDLRIAGSRGAALVLAVVLGSTTATLLWYRRRRRRHR